MKNLLIFLTIVSFSSCSIIKRATPTEDLPLGTWHIKNAYVLESRKKQSPITNLQGHQIRFDRNRQFEVKNQENESIYYGKWRITSLDFSVSFTDSTGTKSQSDYKRVLAIFADNAQWSILGEANFYKNEIAIYERDGKVNKRYILRRVN
ncbi:MAG: hypothetical protein ACK4NY_06350 [Spirosomataceae bacterium]